MSAYNGEHLLPGYLGQFFIILSITAGLLSIYGYWQTVKRERFGDLAFLSPFYQLGRIAFITHFASIVGIFITLFYIIYNHLFEYHYAWRHSSTNLPLKYILSSFWEGSEGSFLLWAFWQAALSMFVIYKKHTLENRVMIVIAGVQVLLMSMVLGFYWGDSFKLGSSPFVLLRHQMSDSPIFANPDYLKFIEDGNGLNPLLQNYWMTIHPPVLFLGFATALFPFAYVVAALWKGEYKSFITPTLRWSLATGGFLGLGIMMGGIWAYESLTFGGYWAWDPVENASLVPWMILIAGLHTLVVYKATGRSLKITLVFLLLSYLFVWYSTFLTRTGVLGETSVHSFTDSGKALYYHLLVAIAVFVFFPLWWLIRRWSKMPKVAGEEDSNSREFWMLFGAIILLTSAMLIIFYTSLPVWAPAWKWITGNDIAPPSDPVAFYNKQQVFFAAAIALLSGSIQYLKFKKSRLAAFWKQNLLLAGIAVVLTVLLALVQDITAIPLLIFAFASIYAIVANVHYILTHHKLKLGKAGGAITHLSFGLMLLAILFSSYKKQIISLDRTGQVLDWGKESFQENLKESRENVLMFRNAPITMKQYIVTYLGDSLVSNDPPIRYFKLRFERRNPETNALEEEFFLYPNIFVNTKGKEAMGSNPDKKHYLTKDVFTYISSTSDPDAKADTNSFKPFIIKKNDSIFLTNGYMVYEQMMPKGTPTQDAVVAEAKLSVYDSKGKLGEVLPQYVIEKDQIYTVADTLNEMGVTVQINKINPESETVEFGVKQKGQTDDFVVVKTVIYPFIGLLWFSVALMFIGFMVSWYQRRSRQ